MQEARPLQQSSSRSLRQAASIADEGNRTHESFLQRLRRRSSSTGGQKQATVSTRPTVTVHVAALGSGQWTDEPSSTVSSADCAVDLDAHKVVKENIPHKACVRLNKCIIALVVLALIAAAITVPILMARSFETKRPAAVQRVIPAASPAHRIIFAFDSEMQPKASSILPAAVTQEVVQWNVLPTSGIHIAAFSSYKAMQDALAVFSNSTALKYAVADFQLAADRTVNSIIGTDKLRELSKLPTKGLLHLSDPPAPDSSQNSNKQDNSTKPLATPQASRAPATHGQRLAQRKTRRQLLSQGLHAAHVPDTARLDRLEPPAGLPGTYAALNPGQQATTTACGAGVGPMSGRSGTLCAHSVAVSNLNNSASRLAKLLELSQQRRRLQQHTDPPPPPEPQPQQRQAVYQPQRGGTGVAWYLMDPAVQTREAWNITYGDDSVVIAVIDSGVELSHGGVGAASWVNAGEIAADGIDNDGNGLVDDVSGWDFGGTCGDAACSYCIPGPDPTDTAGWGSHAAAVIAAEPEVASGTSGVAPGVRIMPLKIAGCHGAMQLGDFSAQQLAAGYKSVSDVGGTPSDWQAVTPGPLMLGSAAMQALDYAVLNGAHIVLAAWVAGGVLDSAATETVDSNVSSSSNSSSSNNSSAAAIQCVLGSAAAAATGLPAGSASAGNSSTAACVAAAQKLLFQDALKPLETAGVLVVTMQPDQASSSSSSDSSSSSSIPCSLSQDLSNILCIGSAAEAGGSTEALSKQVLALDYFDLLLYNMKRNLTAEAEASNDTALPAALSNNDSLVHITSTANIQGLLRTFRNNHWAQVTAPGHNILAGWAWAGHATVSGGSAAAAVAAGAAALIWSALGQALGADASAAAQEGLAKLVKDLIISGSSSTSQVAAVAAAAADDSQGGSAMERGGVAPEGLNMLRSMQLATKYTGPLQLHPTQISPSITLTTPTLSYSWYISTSLSGPYATDQMPYVASKALFAPYFPLINWEFYGATSLVEVLGFVVITSPGDYSIAAISQDKFLVWLNDKWLVMKGVDHGGSVGLRSSAWTADVQFEVAGYYKLRIIVYNPGQSPFDLKWKAAGAANFTTIPHFVSFGRSQPLPQQLLQDVTANMLSGAAAAASSTAGSSSSGSSAAVSSEQSRGIRSSDDAADLVGAGLAAVVEGPDSSTGSDAAAGVSSGSSSDTAGGSSSSSSSGGDGGSVHAVQNPFSASAAPPKPDAADPALYTEEQQQSPMQRPQAAYDDGFPPDPALTDQIQQQQQQQQTGYEAQPYQDQPSYMPPLTPSYPADFNLGGLLSSLFGWERGASSSSGGGGSGRAGGAESSAMPSDSSDAARTSSTSAPAASSSPTQDSPSTASTRSLLASQWMTPTRTVSPLPGNLAVAATMISPSSYRTILPALSDLQSEHTAILQGPGLKISANWELQRMLLGASDANDDRAGYGVVQGWLSWQDLNPVAATWIHDTLNPTSGSVPPALPGAGIVAASTAGVQFELTCANPDTQLSCSLHIDGALVVGVLDQTKQSSCITPARRLLSGNSSNGSSGNSPFDPEYLAHLELLFVADDMRAARFGVTVRPCSLDSNGSVQVANGASFVDLVPAAGASALGLAVSAVQSAAGSSYQPGMLCNIKATVPPAAGSNSSSSDTQALHRVVYVSAAELQQALQVDPSYLEAPTVFGNNPVDLSIGSNSTDTIDPHLEPTARNVAGTRGLGLQELVPDWAQSLPWNTLYDVSCGCYWNGSWAGNVSINIHAGGTGSAGLYLAGWPVSISPLLPLYGPSDIDVTLYSTWQQQQQLMSGSNTADNLRWQADGEGHRYPNVVAAATATDRAALLADLGFRPMQLTGGITFPLGDIDGVGPIYVPEQSGYLQMLVIQGKMMDADARIVISTVVEGVYRNDTVTGASSGAGRSRSWQGPGPAATGWLPGPFDAWVPV